MNNFARRHGLVSYLGVPLIVRDQFIGNLVIYTTAAHTFSPEEIEFFTNLGSQAAIAIHNARLYEETERRRHEAEELARVARSLTEILDPTVVGERIVTSVRELFGVQGSTLRLSQVDGSLRLLASSGEVFSRTSTEDALPSGVGLTSRAIAEGKPFWSTDILNDPKIVLTDEMRDYQIRSGNRSMIVVPLHAHEKLIGTLTLSDRTGRTYSDNEAALLQTFADQAALALENARLYEQTERQLKRIEALREIEKSITSTLDLSTVLNVLMEKIDVFFTYPAAATVRLFDKHAGLLEPAAARNIEITEWITAMRGVQPNERSYGRVVVEQKEPLVIANLQTDSRTQNPNFYREHGLISYAGVPLIAKGEVLGVLGIYTKEEHSFSKEEIELLMVIAGQAAIAIHNARLYDEIGQSKNELETTNQNLERSLKQLGGLYTALAPIAAAATTQEMIGGIVERLMDATGADAAAIRVSDNNTGGYPVLSQNGYSDEFLEIVGMAPAGGAVDWVIRHGEPLIAKDLASDTRFKSNAQLKLGLRSCAILPLTVHNEVRGVIHVSSRKPWYFDDEQKDHLTAIARQLSIALENRELFNSLKSSNRFLDKSLSQLSGLYTAMTPLGLSESLGEMMNGIVGRLIEATGADAALVQFWNREAGNYPVIGHMGYSSEFIEGARPERAEGAVGWVIQHGEPIIAIDIASDDRLKRKGQLKMGFQSCAILPLRVHDEVRGVIQFSSRTRGYFDEEQKNHLLAVARQMSIALENRELFYSLKASRDELERANRVKDEFLSVMSHELRTPLSVVLGYSRMFHEQQLGPLTQDQQQAVNVVMRNSQELLEMIEGIMDATKIEAGSMTAEMDSLSPLELLQEIKVAYDVPIAKNVRLEWQLPQSLPLLWSDIRKLRQILTNLINNAIKFTEEGCIVIGAEEKRSDGEKSAEHWIEFRVSDSGVGIPPEECENIFERFHQVDSSQTRRYEGVGLGLHIVKSFTELLGGRVSVCSQLGEGSTFTVRLPIKTAS